MELKMEVYTPQLELLGVLEVYDALLLEDLAFQPGSFSLKSTITEETKALLVPEHIIWFEGETAGIIEFLEKTVAEGGTVLSVKGSLLSGILRRRVLWGIYNLYDSIPAMMYHLVADCAVSPSRGDAQKRKIPGLALRGEPPEDPRKFRKQKTGGELADALTELAQAGQVAYGVGFDPCVPQMEFWARAGVDRTITQNKVEPVFYSTELDDVLAATYSYHSNEYKNLVLVAGEGDGETRKTAVVNAVQKGRRLPIGYTELEYIESAGAAYINTGFFPSSETRVVMDVEFSAVQTSCFFGCRNQNTSAATESFSMWCIGGTSFRSDYYGASASATFSTATNRWKIDKNKNVTLVNDMVLQSPPVHEVITSTYSIFLLAINNMGSAIYMRPIKLYSCTIYDQEAVKMDLIPCKNSLGAYGMYDLVGKAFYGNKGSGTFLGGSEVEENQPEPEGLWRREVYVDARDLQSSNGDQAEAMPEAAYLEILKTRGLERLAEQQLVQSFSATVRTVDPTYEYGVDFFLGDTITVVDERLGVTVEAVVEGVERGISKAGEDFVLTLGYSMPTISDKLRKAGV